MPHQANVNIDCRMVGDYVDEAELPANAAFASGEVVRPQSVADYLDDGLAGAAVKEFTVLLKDGSLVTVRGHALKHWPTASAEESGSYGVVVDTAGKEVLIALFRTTEVVGIFHGEIRPDRRIA